MDVTSMAVLLFYLYRLLDVKQE